MNIDILSFDEAIAASKSNRHVLLGNGFSRALFNDIFAYDALFDAAKDQGVSRTALAAFEALKSRDFEVVMSALSSAAALIEVYSENDRDIASMMLQDAEALREVLARTISANHPDRPNAITAEQFAACRSFLANFRNYYTVNYDLLLYWAAMNDDSDVPLRFDDGFRTPDSGEAEYVTWEVENTDQQNAHYLHGALHLFDAGAELQKYTWCNTGLALIDQIRDALSHEKYPLYVAEGTSAEKKKRIVHSGYLHRSYRSFARIGGALFIFGHSLAPNDNHILDLIARGRLQEIFVSLYGDPHDDANQSIIMRAKSIVQDHEERKGKSLKLRFYDASTARVWG